MRKVHKRLALVLVAVLAALAIAAHSAYRASQHVPEFYAEAMQLDVEHAARASQELESRVTMLYSDVVNQEQWYAQFTDRQINAYLAVDFMEDYGPWISANVFDPRVKITPAGIVLAVRIDQGLEPLTDRSAESEHVRAHTDLLPRTRRLPSVARRAPRDDRPPLGGLLQEGDEQAVRDLGRHGR